MKRIHYLLVAAAVLAMGAATSTKIFYVGSDNTIQSNLVVPTGRTITATGSGTIAATALATTRTIGGSNFDGTGNVTSFPSPGAIGGTTPSTGAFTTVNSSTGQHTVTVTGTGGSSYGGIAPITLYAKSVTVLTAGAPADIATITIPAGITRWMVQANITDGVLLGCLSYVETAAGTLADATYDVRTAASGGGTGIAADAGLEAASGGYTTMAPAFGGTGLLVGTASTLYIRQTANSANAGTVSFYITIYPLP